MESPGVPPAEQALAPGAAADSKAAPTPPRAAPPALALSAEPIEGRVRWSVQNRDRDQVRVASRVRLEREVGQAFETFEAALALGDDCAQAPPPCRELVPGAELRPSPWLGTAGKGQCACEGCEPAPAGRYRMVLEGCDGEYRVDGPAFALSPD